VKRQYSSFVSREEAAMRRDTDPDYQLHQLSADLAELADWLDDIDHIASMAASYAANLCRARESLKELEDNHPSPDELGGGARL
jgi:hypothetical protein